jgi:hypothetical protein
VSRDRRQQEMSMISHGWSAFVTVTARAVLLAVVWLCVAPSARAQSGQAQAQAEVLFEEGRKLKEQGSLREAAEKFEAANRIYPAVGTLLNLGVVRRDSGELVAAWEAFERAADLARRTKDNRESYARERMKELEPQLYLLRIEVPAAVRTGGLVITADTQPVSEERWGTPFPVASGTHVIRAERPGVQPFEARVEVNTKGQTVEVEIPAALPEQAAPPPVGPTGRSEPAPTATPEVGAAAAPGMPMTRKVALGGFAVGALGLVAGGVLGMRAIGQYDDAESICARANFTSCTEAESIESQELRDASRSTANLATASVVVGLAAGAVGAVLWFTGAPEEPGRPESARILPIIEPGMAGVSLRLGF